MDINSIWTQTADAPHFPQLKGNIQTDVLVIGGGIAGILCAYMLKEQGVDYVLAEAGKICGGVTQCTTAKITVQHGLIYDRIIRKYGEDTARFYLQAQQRALQKYRILCREIPCDFKELDSFVYSRKDRVKIEREVAALNKIGCQATFADEVALPFGIAGAVCVKDQAQFHPIKLLYALAKHLRIYEHTRVLELRPDGAVTRHGVIKAKKIIVATHFPFLNKHGAYFLKLYQHRSYVLALKNAPHVHGMYVDEDKKGLSFRDCGDYLLLGGGSHRTGKKGGNWQELSEFAKSHYPTAQEVYRWATQDCMTLDDIPYIGLYSQNTPDLYVATGFNKWGMTSSMVSAMILTDLIQGRKNDFAEVFSPSRSILHPQFAVNAFESVWGLVRPTTPRCPHLGCALIYNAQERSWDCPCHGSRFDEKGKLIDNPATGDKKIP